MKLQIPAVLLILSMGFTACNSDRSNNSDPDSVMTDSSVIDTAINSPGITDTSNIDSLNLDSAK
ncbi:hypothetical protein [Pedobacter steynii]